MTNLPIEVQETLNAIDEEIAGGYKVGLLRETHNLYRCEKHWKNPVTFEAPVEDLDLINAAFTFFSGGACEVVTTTVSGKTVILRHRGYYHFIGC